MTRPDFYDAEYYRAMRGTDAADGDHPAALYDIFLGLLDGDDLPALSILDAGCGRGELMALLLRAGAAEVWGFDFSPAAVAASRQRLSAAAGREAADRVVEGSIAEAGLFPDDRFDVIFATDVVEHLPPPLLAAGLGNLRRWLKPDGKLLIHTFPTLGPHRLYQRYLKLTGDAEALARLNTAHCNVQTRATLRDAVTAAGLSCERLWLQNDFAATSTAYQAMPAGGRKRLVKFLFDDIARWPPTRRLIAALGLAEFANMSIYCACRKGG